MIHLALNLATQEDDFRAAASRMRRICVVDRIEEADAIVSDQAETVAGNKPALFLGCEMPPDNPNVFPAFPWRFDPCVLAVRQSLAAGSLGKPLLLRLHCWTPPPPILDDRARIHGIDLALWIFGEQPNAIFSPSPAGADRSRSAGLEIIHLGFSSGGMALLDFVCSLPEGENYRSLSLIGTNGAAYADDHRDRNLFFGGGPPGATPPDTTRAFIRPMLEDFISAVLDGAGSTRAARDYLNALSVLRRARQPQA